jgi:hypothetical protein
VAGAVVELVVIAVVFVRTPNEKEPAPMAQYLQLFETKIIRRRHQIAISQHSDADSIKRALANVPSAAKIELSESGSYEDEQTGVTRILLTFLEETSVKTE